MLLHERFILRKFLNLLKIIINNTAYRIGGDEFIVILENVLETDFQDFVNRLEASVAHNRHVSLSVGYFWNNGSMVISDHIHQAELMMYKQKKNYYETVNNRRKN